MADPSHSTAKDAMTGDAFSPKPMPVTKSVTERDTDLSRRVRPERRWIRCAEAHFARRHDTPLEYGLSFSINRNKIEFGFDSAPEGYPLPPCFPTNFTANIKNDPTWANYRWTGRYGQFMECSGLGADAEVENINGADHRRDKLYSSWEDCFGEEDYDDDSDSEYDSQAPKLVRRYARPPKREIKEEEESDDGLLTESAKRRREGSVDVSMSAASSVDQTETDFLV